MQIFKLLQVLCNHKRTHIRNIPVSSVIFYDKFLMLQILQDFITVSWNGQLKLIEKNPSG